MNIQTDAYIVEWKEKGELVTDLTPRTEFEALNFAIKKSLELKNIPAWIKRAEFMPIKQMSIDTLNTKKRALVQDISK
jgi:hypothetical protein